MSDTPKIGALAPWFGAKRTLAPAIVQELGGHQVYWEPFCGSLAVLMAKPPCVMETANDLHGDLVNLARVLRCEAMALELYGRAARLVFHETMYLEARSRMEARQGGPAPDAPDIDRAEDFLTLAWFGRNGVTGTRQYNNGFCVRYTANGGHSASRWRSVVGSIPAWHSRLRNVTILNRDAFGLLERVRDEKGTAIYADPPYLVKGAHYVHDFDTDGHRRLAEALCRFRRARVVVSYYDHPRLAELYSGWRKRSIEVTKSLVNQGHRDSGGATKVVEVLLVNDDCGERTASLFASGLPLTAWKESP